MAYAPRQWAYNIDYQFERRRYSNRTYTWLHWRKATHEGVGESEWQTYGDPWPSVRISKADLREALNDIRFGMLTVGAQVRLGNGPIGTVQGLNHATKIAQVTINDWETTKVFDVPASNIVEILQEAA